MSRKQDVPPMVPFEKNIDEQPGRFVVVDAGYEVASWRPGRAHSGEPATQVHLILPVFDIKLVLRLKSARALDELVGVLLQHRKDVWGDK